jgi:D-glycerate 3-kinase
MLCTSIEAYLVSGLSIVDMGRLLDRVVTDWNIGTHDVALLQSFLDDILQGRPTKVPVYDKSLHQGRGDRAPISQWLSIPNPRNYKIIIVEGWCVGFESIPEHRLVAAYGGSSRTLSQHTLEHLRVMNDYLVDYAKILKFDAFVHIDAEDLSWVYEWRQEQEDAMRRDKGDETVGMSKEEVVKFVDGYYPAYELYTEDLRKGMFRNATQDSEGRHLRLIVGRDRKVKEVKRL